MTETDEGKAERASKRLAWKHIEVVVNPASGSVAPGATDDMRRILQEGQRPAEVHEVEPDNLMKVLQAATDRKPDLLIVLAGDGTARAAAELCGPKGPVIAPLAGGTMNMLPHAIYGKRPWQEALAEILDNGVIKTVGGGMIGPPGSPDGQHHFYVAAILGAPALWAHAREAVRMGHVAEAADRARYAYRRAFSTRLKFALDGGERQSAEALTLLCPLISKAMSEDEDALEAAALDPHGAAEAFRLGFKTLMSQWIGDWRQDPAVTARKCRSGLAWASGRIPAILDGEPVRLPSRAEIVWQSSAFRVLAPGPTPPETPV